MHFSTSTKNVYPEARMNFIIFISLVCVCLFCFYFKTGLVKTPGTTKKDKLDGDHYYLGTESMDCVHFAWSVYTRDKGE